MKDREKTIMIVEDDVSVAYLLRDVLEAKGYRCLIESDGEEVLSRSVDEMPDLILLDIKLVGIDGFTVCRRLKSDDSTADIPVVFISALHTEKDVMEAKQAGGVYFVGKPFDLDFLIKKIREILVLYNSNQHNRMLQPRVLFVDAAYPFDQIVMDGALPSLLAETDLDVHLLRDPRETLRYTRELQPEIIILDMDGALIPTQVVADALGRNKFTQDTPVIILSAMNGRTRWTLDHFPNVKAVLQKPLTKLDLVQTIRRNLSKRMHPVFDEPMISATM